jgi:uncharacterized protein (DUF362 family)
MPVVSIVTVEGDCVQYAVRRAIEIAGGLEAVIPPGSSVLLKPNVVSPSPSGSGKITDARVTEAVVKAVLENSPGRVAIGEGSSVGYDFPGRKDSMHCLEVSGTADVARRLGVELVDLNRDERVEVRAVNAFVMEKFAVARTAWEADVIIDLPVIKTHVRTGITCGLKNMKGVLPGDEKKRTHQLGLDRGIVDLNRVVKPHFTLVDAIVGMEGTWQYPEDSVRLGCIVAGVDVVAVDAICVAIAGFDVEQILHIQLAAQEGLGVADLDRIEVRGKAITDVARKFVPYQEAAQNRFSAARIIERNACTGCMGEMISTFIYLNRAGFGDRLADLILVMGTPDELPEMSGTPVIVGKCPRAFRHRGIYIPGCPPHGIAITDGACEALGIDTRVIHKVIEELHDF